MRPTIPVLAILALPILEIATFIYIGGTIGALKTILLVMLAAVLGVAVLRYQGLSAFRKINRDIRKGHPPEAGIADGFLIVIAGILLIIPGFLTDIIGLLLLIPILRHLAWGLVSRNMVVHYDYASDFRNNRRQEDYVDLAPEDYRRDDERPNNGPQLRRPD